MNCYELSHHGIKGQKWGVRRYQNEDGSLTAAGKQRYRYYNRDSKLYGERTANKIANRIDKGESYGVAKSNVLVRSAITGVAIATLSAAALSVAAGEFDRIVDFGKGVADKYYNTTIYDKNGEVITRYHDTVRAGKAVCNALMQR